MAVFEVPIPRAPAQPCVDNARQATTTAATSGEPPMALRILAPFSAVTLPGHCGAPIKKKRVRGQFVHSKRLMKQILFVILCVFISYLY